MTGDNQISSAQLMAARPQLFKVLVVDDDDRIVEALSTILGREGYQVFSAPDSYLAWETIEREHPDLTVMDVLLPGIDGIELCRRIKQQPDTRLSMVILMTGIAERSRRLDGLAVGADDFLKKPIDPFELTVRVRTLLKTKELYDEIESHRRDLERRVAERTRELQEANVRLHELNRVKSNVLAIVSHELRTPLMKVKSGMWLSMQDDLEKQKRAQVKKMVEDALNVLEYRISDVGIFSDPTDFNVVPVVVTDLIASAIEQIKILQPGQEDRIRIDAPKDLPPVMVDHTAIARVLAHIIDNGLKFSGKKRVSVRALRAEENVVITIQDKGIGISPAKQERLFLPLEQGDESTTRKHGGLGMGLALVKMILDAHQIQFAISSKEGGGTTVTLTLPTTRA